MNERSIFELREFVETKTRETDFEHNIIIFFENQ
jgi:hypothetical protein